MDKLKKYLLGISALVLVIPGYHVLYKDAFYFPPHESKALYYGLVQVSSGITIMLLWLYRARIRKFKENKIVVLSLIFFLLFVISTILFIHFYDKYVLIITPGYSDKNSSDTIYYPLCPPETLVNSLRMWTSDQSPKPKIYPKEFSQKYGPDSYREVLRRCDVNFISTKIIFIMLYQLIFVFLVLTFGFISIRTYPLKR
jgi:hypothetical protein